MTDDQFATAADLASFLGVTIAAGADTNRANLLLQLATAEIQAYCEQKLSLVTSETITIRGLNGALILLPELPVVSVATVVEDGVTLTVDTDYRLEPYGILRRLSGTSFIGWSPYFAVWPTTFNVAVTYTHGYATIPVDLKAICLETAARQWSNPLEVESESITNYSVTYGSAGTALAVGTLSLDARQLLDRKYRLP